MHSGLSSFRRRAVPTNVPLVPRPATKCVIRPSVCSPDLRSRWSRSARASSPDCCTGPGKNTRPARQRKSGARGGWRRPILRPPGCRPTRRHRRGGCACAPGDGIGGEAQLHAITQRRADHGVGDAGVAAGGVQNGLAGSQRAAAFAFPNHVQRRAVFDRSARIEPLRLGVKTRRRDIGAADPLEAQKRRVADAFHHPGAQLRAFRLSQKNTPR